MFKMTGGVFQDGLTKRRSISDGTLFVARQCDKKLQILFKNPCRLDRKEMII